MAGSDTDGRNEVGELGSEGPTDCLLAHLLAWACDPPRGAWHAYHIGRAPLFTRDESQSAYNCMQGFEGTPQPQLAAT
ncbi:hypothetical protein AXG93_1835s1000 [Marchantia polymorpha subsp. ruderalis]|uniref:Uncharacterized protein n=1 Tax=Marchantia polymorpha subsp. ruderalis TaxID=1480154 RepID=A0A176VMS8_MARPO|nr:hypothetical protein AXG93_1835s1000 [Marchantia polymorpha subsp. ruderalis]